MNIQYLYKNEYSNAKYINLLMNYIYNIYNVNSTNIYDQICKILYNVINEIDTSNNYKITNKFWHQIEKKNKTKNNNKPKKISNQNMYKLSKLNIDDVDILNSKSNLLKKLKRNERIGGGDIIITQYNGKNIPTNNFILLYENAVTDLKVFMKYNDNNLELLFKFSGDDFLIKGNLNQCQINSIEIGGNADVKDYQLITKQVIFVNYRLILKIYTQVAIVLTNIIRISNKEINIDQKKLIEQWSNNYTYELLHRFPKNKIDILNEEPQAFFNRYETTYNEFINSKYSQPITNTKIELKNEIGTCYLYPLMPALIYNYGDITTDNFNLYVGNSVYYNKDIISYLKCGIIWDIVTFYIFGLFNPNNVTQIQQIQQIQKHVTNIDSTISKYIRLHIEIFNQTYGSVFNINKITPVYGKGHAGFYIQNNNKDINNNPNSENYSNQNDMIHIYDGNHIENGPIYNLCISNYNSNFYEELLKIEPLRPGFYKIFNNEKINVINLNLSHFQFHNPNFNKFGDNYIIQIYTIPGGAYYHLYYDLLYNNNIIATKHFICDLFIKEYHKQFFSVCTHIIIDLLYGIWTIMHYDFSNDNERNNIYKAINGIYPKDIEAKNHEIFYAIDYQARLNKNYKDKDENEIFLYQNVPQINELNSIIPMKQSGGSNILKYILFVIIIIIIIIKKIIFPKHHIQYFGPILQN